MPYRRLPNTDAARIRAMKEALKKFDIMNNKIYCLEAEPKDEKDNPEILVYNLPGN